MDMYMEYVRILSLSELLQPCANIGINRTQESKQRNDFIV